MLNCKDWLLGQETELEQMLEGRERRAAFQRAMLDKGGTLVCFTLNLAGPVKTFPLGQAFFLLTDQRLTAALAQAGLPLLERELLPHPWGWEGYYRVDGQPLAVKRVTAALEGETPAGRLLDLDVLSPDGRAVSRSRLGLEERPCLVCGRAGRECASSRAHPVAQLQERTVDLLKQAAREEGARPLVMGRLCTMALLHEVYTTPKPGLVDRANNGAHRDMDVPLFEASAHALTGYFQDLFQLGRQLAELSPCQLLPHLRPRGRQAEAEMYQVTGGINTHKGAIFSMGLLSAALGHLLARQEKTKDALPSVHQWLDWAGAMAAPALRRDFDGIDGQSALTAGARQYRDYGLLGIRGEAASGFQSVRAYSLPALRTKLAEGEDLQQAGVTALLELMAHVSDSNVIARGGLERAQAVRALIAEQRDRGMGYPTAWVKELDQTLIAWNVSPGGCADLLAATYLIVLAEELGYVNM